MFDDVERHPIHHFARAGSDGTMHLHHSQACLERRGQMDLGQCLFSLALDDGLQAMDWIGVDMAAATVRVSVAFYGGFRLVPADGPGKRKDVQ